jgi:hypothetical protein
MTLSTKNAEQLEKPTASFSSSAALQRTHNLLLGAEEDKREEISLYFTNTFDTYTQLFDCLADDEAYYQKAIPLRHPLIFYLGHTATFFVNKLILA